MRAPTSRRHYLAGRRAMSRPTRFVLALLAAFALSTLLRAQAPQDTGTQGTAQWRFEAGG